MGIASISMVFPARSGGCWKINNRPFRSELSAATCRKEKTLDLWFHKIKGHQWMMGSLIYVTSYFLQICVWGSLLSTLDSLLFCIFIIQPDRRKYKMGCSIKESAKVWKIRRFTDDFGCGMIFMLGGFREEAAFFVGTGCRLFLITLLSHMMGCDIMNTRENSISDPGLCGGTGIYR